MKYEKLFSPDQGIEKMIKNYRYTFTLNKKYADSLQKQLQARGYSFSGFLNSVIRSGDAGLKKVKKHSPVTFACFILEDTGKKGDDKFEGHVNDGL